jgi:exonuclease III
MKMDNKIKLISNNVRGLQSYEKRRKLFHYFNALSEADIIMLQETHSTTKIENQWRAEWGGQVYFCHGTNDARGVCILMKNNVDFDLTNIQTDKEGRFLQITGVMQKKSILIANIYAPNKDDIPFFTTIQENMEAQRTRQKRRNSQTCK